ncbi:hypothetical protein GOODEAATRI_002741 [Goodea atripinnis]|uniref:Uncharacterized protein n=1 Tax=Goodea atripinnis TaxID=208336 RepID=A0ABV0P152_9TELE
MKTYLTYYCFHSDHIDERTVCNAVAPNKDVDGFHVVNVGRLCLDQSTMLPATPWGVWEIIKRTGRSKNVGMPIAMLLHTDSRHERPGGELYLYMYLGVHLADDLTWSVNTSTLVKKAHQRLVCRTLELSLGILLVWWRVFCAAILQHRGSAADGGKGCIEDWGGFYPEAVRLLSAGLLLS